MGVSMSLGIGNIAPSSTHHRELQLRATSHLLFPATLELEKTFQQMNQFGIPLRFLL